MPMCVRVIYPNGTLTHPMTLTLPPAHIHQHICTRTSRTYTHARSVPRHQTDRPSHGRPQRGSSIGRARRRPSDCGRLFAQHGAKDRWHCVGHGLQQVWSARRWDEKRQKQFREGVIRSVRRYWGRRLVHTLAIMPPVSHTPLSHVSERLSLAVTIILAPTPSLGPTITLVRSCARSHERSRRTLGAQRGSLHFQRCASRF